MRNFAAIIVALILTSNSRENIVQGQNELFSIFNVELVLLWFYF